MITRPIAVQYKEINVKDRAKLDRKFLTRSDSQHGDLRRHHEADRQDTGSDSARDKHIDTVFLYVAI